MIKGISAVTLATHDMRRAVGFYRLLDMQLLYGGEDAATIVEREGLTQVADTAALAAVVDQVLAANPRAVEDWKRGKKAAAGALVGQVMKATQGKANPGVVNSLLQEKLAQL